MTGLRTYGDPCGIARALDVIGERWALLIVRELLLGPRRFTDLRGALGASPNVLSQRLAELEGAGVVQKRSAGGALYELTDWGLELHPILLQLGVWGARSKHRPAGDLSVDALLLALEATFVGSRAAGTRAAIELRLGPERFAVEIDAGTITFRRGSSGRRDAIIVATTETLRAVVFGDVPLGEASIELEGDRSLARKFLRWFARPGTQRS